jgi:pfkB family carbohydrate kinase
VTVADLPKRWLSSNLFHLICDPNRAVEIKSGIYARVREQNSDSEPDGKFFWEPVPGRCSPDYWEGCKKAMKEVHFISPNINEAAGFLGRKIDEEEPFEGFKLNVEKVAQEYLRHFGDRLPLALIIRCGKHGVLVVTKSQMVWLPAYHETLENVIDPTGGGNAFCGGYCEGLLRSGDDLVKAAVYGNVAASFAIEQFGLPRLEYYKDWEMWNGERVCDRLERYTHQLRNSDPQFSTY